MASGEIHPGDRDSYAAFTDIQSLRSFFQSGKPYTRFYYRSRYGGGFRWISMDLVAAGNYGPDNSIIYLYIRDVHEDFVTHIEERDFLTSGLNRRGFIKQAQNFLNQADENCSYAILMYNIKNFKAINEFLGTDSGDDLLRDTYQRLSQSFLKPVMIARMDGDHFFCLVNQDCIHYDMLPGLCKSAFSRDNKNIGVHACCGIYLITDRTLSVSTMCDYAKIAIGHIYDEYVKPYAVFEISMRKNYIIHSEIQGQVFNALKDGQFEVYYQPIFNAHTGEITSAEALIRWNHPERGVVSPGLFIPVLEENGYITQLDRFVLNEVLDFQRRRKKEGKRTVPVSINLSWMDFYDKELMQAILDELNSDENILLVRFEVTETSYAALSNNEEDIITKLREAGAEVLLDDFGSGYSSFSTFSDYDFDIIKLDMGFVQKLDTDDKTKSIIHSIIDMSHHMNARVIAEGVETKSQLDFLDHHNCDYIQGYYFSRPLQQGDFVHALEKKQENPQ